MAFTVRTINRSEFDRYEAVAMQTFGGDVPEGESRLAKVLRVERAYAAFDGDEIVGTAGAFDHQLTIGGGSAPMAGLTFVSVLPSHRRQGVLRALMAKHNDDMEAHGECISGLWASESSIYSRFGYGIAAEAHYLETDARTLRFAREFVPDSIRFVDIKEAQEQLEPLYEAIREQRPGFFTRTDSWWKTRTLYDGPGRRGSGSNLRVATAIRDGRLVGYILYRQTADNNRGLLDGAVTIAELIGIDLKAEQSLWHFAAHLDLYPHLTYWNAPLDCALPWLVEDRRRVRLLRTDTLWLRLHNIPAALEAREYLHDGQLSLSLRGEDASYALRVVDGRASCETGHSEDAINLSREDLSSLFLGTVQPSQLAAVGRLDGTKKAVAVADALFKVARVPWCPEIF
tara:strand:+ start:47377 stop:48576 length:1200 start_codon:yes stop_codon:yes gene_type:complete